MREGYKANNTVFQALGEGTRSPKFRGREEKRRDGEKGERV
jgi:hypothetical protein